MNRRKLFLSVLALVVLSAGHHAADADVGEIAVIVNRSNGVGPMNRSQLSAIFKSKSTSFPGGGRADPVNLAPENPVRQEYDLVVLGMTPDEVERFWLDNKIRSGVGSPRRLSGPDAVVRFVAGDAAGIGYVETSDTNDSVRIVARIRGGRVLPP
jgi:hypothetical protein